MMQGKKIAISADLGGTNLRVAAVDESGRIVHREKVPTPSDKGAEGILGSIASIAKTCIEETKNVGRPAGFALALPAVLDLDNGVVTESPNLPVLNGIPVASELATRIPLPVYLENDATAAAIGEHWLGASKDHESSICITLGTGVGGGIIIDGKPLRGIDGTAGEVGHVNIEPFGHPCGCGGVGCLEQYASATALVRMAGEEHVRFPDSRLVITDDLTSRDIYEAGKAGDALAIELFRRMGFALGLASAGFVNLLNPEVIVIGGGAAAGWDLFIHEMTKTLHARAFYRPAKRVRIVRASLGDDAGSIGAASLVFSKTVRGRSA